jgi:protein-disulfide isomerase
MVKEKEEANKGEGWENLIAIVIVAIVAAGVGLWVYTQATATPAPVDNARVQVPISVSPSFGDADAAMTVVIFSDFECPYCGEFARSTFPKVKEQFVDTGQIRFVFKHFPISTHKYAEQAALAAFCADQQGKFWEFHDTLFANQESLTLDDLAVYAGDLGLDKEQFDSCMETSGAAMLRDRTLGEQLGVTGTPTFFFNGRKVVGALSAEEFAQEIAQG